MSELQSRRQGGPMPEADVTSVDLASTFLVRATGVPVSRVDAFAGWSPLAASPSPPTEDEQATVLRSLHFGNAFTDHMTHTRWRQGEGQDDYGTIPYGSLSLSPAVAVLHYGQEVFEGIKAYRREDGSVWTFHPHYNVVRLNASARHVALLELAEEDFVASLMDLVRTDVVWVPSSEGESLYLRSPTFVSEVPLGVRPVAVVDYYVIASPTGFHFPYGLKPISIWVTTECHHVERGGTGAAKTGGNYTSFLLPQQETYAQGCDQVCFLSDVSQKNIGEFGGMSLIVVDADGTVRTPRPTGTVLEDCTRSAIIRLLCGSGRNVVEETISLQGLLADIESGRISEVFAYGTTAVIMPLGHLKGEGLDARIEGNEAIQQTHDRLTAAQIDYAKGPYGWIYRPMPPRS